MILEQQFHIPKMIPEFLDEPKVASSWLWKYKCYPQIVAEERNRYLI